MNGGGLWEFSPTIIYIPCTGLISIAVFMTGSHAFLWNPGSLPLAKGFPFAQSFFQKMEYAGRRFIKLVVTCNRTRAETHILQVSALQLGLTWPELLRRFTETNNGDTWEFNFNNITNLTADEVLHLLTTQIDLTKGLGIDSTENLKDIVQVSLQSGRPDLLYALMLEPSSSLPLRAAVVNMTYNLLGKTQLAFHTVKNLFFTLEGEEGLPLISSKLTPGFKGINMHWYLLYYKHLYCYCVILTCSVNVWEFFCLPWRYICFIIL